MGITVFDNVSFSYDSSHLTLSGVSVDIEAGDFVCLLGANGSGKTTLARLMNALLEPSEGNVVVFGFDTRDHAHTFDIRSNVGMVFQNPDDQIVASLVEDDVAFGPANLAIPSDELKSRVSDALAAVGLSEFERREIATLSGGQKQRVAIAGALALKPSILVLDEPTSMLDPLARNQLMDLCHTLNKDGLTIVLITHFLEEAAQAHRVLVLDNGAIALDGPPHDVLAHQKELEELQLPTRLPVRAKSRERETETVEGGISECLSFSDVSYRYRDDAPWALEGVSMAIREGELIGITGLNGSGKSTFIQLAGGLLHPTRGCVRAFGIDLADKRASRSARPRMGIVFQYPERQLFAATVFDDVAFGPLNLGMPAEEVETRVREALDLVGLDLEQLRTTSPFALSGGEQRRVAIAGALALRPSLLLLDEPTAGLDPRARSAFFELVVDLCDNHGISIALASHDVDDLEQLCDRIITFENGRIVL
jgi:energy-coupling factor transport system ATP-binding protein